MNKILQLLLLFLASVGFAQDGTIDATFNPATGASNGDVYASAQQADGKTIIGGDFTLLNNSTNKIGRLNTDGTIDSTFDVGTGFNNTVFGITVQPNGKILVVGSFTNYNGTTANRIIRLNSNGSIDPTFIISAGTNGTVNSAALQTDGKIVVVGDFLSYNGTTANRIARLNADGTIDATFAAPGANSVVYSCAIQPDGKIVVVGNFTLLDSVGRNRIVRLNTNGSIDAGFTTGTGANVAIRSICFQPDGKIVIGGRFTTFNGAPAYYILKLNPNGTTDASANYGFELTSNFSVNSIARQADGKLIIGGNFDSYASSDCRNIIRLNNDGSKDSAYGGTPNAGANGIVNSILIQANGKVIVGGAFTSLNLIVRNKLASLNSDGSINTSFYPYQANGTSTNGGVHAITTLSNGKILIGGYFETYNGMPLNNLAKLNADGTLDPSFNTGTGPNSGVLKILVLPNNKIMIVGDFTSYNGVTVNRIVRLNPDGTLDTTFNVGGSGSTSAVRTIALQADGKMIIGGDFYNYNGSPGNFIARLNPDGSKDISFNNRPSGTVWTILIQADGKIIVGGTFITFNDTIPTGGLLRMNPDSTLDTTFNTGGAGAQGGTYVYGTTRQQDGKIVVTGDFQTYNGIPKRNIFRINSNGTLDTSFNCTTVSVGNVLESVVQNDGKIIIGGSLNSPFNGFTGKHIMRLNSDGSLDNTFIQGTGFSGNVRALKLQPDGKVLVGGFFITYNGVPTKYLTRLNSTNTLGLNDFTNKTAVNIFPNPATDFLQFNLPNNFNASSFEVFDTTGKKIDGNLIEQNIIDVRAYANGIYFLHIKTDQGILTSKFIKQ